MSAIRRSESKGSGPSRLWFAAALAALCFGAAPRAPAATRIWDGGDPSTSNWRSRDNWQLFFPAAGDNLTFPSGAARLANNNDFAAGTAFNLITYSGAGYSASGNPLALTGGMTVSHGAGSTIFNPAITLNADQPFTVAAADAVLFLNSAVNLNGRTLTAGGAGLTIAGNNVSGSGAVVKQDSGTLWINANTTYSGFTIVNGGALRVDGVGNSFAIINTGGSLIGSGTVNGFNANGGTISPGVGTPAILRSRNNVGLLAGSTYVVQLHGLAAGVGYDQLSVTGSVDLAGCTLSASAAAGFKPTGGTAFVIIDNDGADAVVGTFSGLPEGEQVLLGTQPFYVRYSGGTGNDVMLIAGPAEREWDGGGADNNWTTAANWVGDTTPGPGDSLTFPAGAARLANNNDFAAGTVFNLITYSGAGYRAFGNRLDLTGGLAVTHGSGASRFIPDITLRSDQTFAVTQPNAVLMIFGTVVLNGRNLTLDAAGNVDLTNFGDVGDIVGVGTVRKTGGGTFYVAEIVTMHHAGQLLVQDGTVHVDGVCRGAVVIQNSGRLIGSGRVNGIEMNGGTLHPSRGFLSSLFVRMYSGSTYEVILSGTATNQYDWLDVQGLVQLTGATLSVSLGFAPTVGTRFVILVNDGNDPIQGAFTGLPEGASLVANGVRLLISYAGGVGNNDVVLTVLPPGVSTWDGGGTNALWSTPANWIGNVSPSPGDTLVFPTNALQRANTNDLSAGTVFGSITFAGSNYVIHGNALHLAGGVTNSSAGTNQIHAGLSLDSVQTFSSGPSVLVLGGAITGNGGIIKTGSGVMEFTGDSPNSFSGPTVVTAGSLHLRKASGVMAIAGPLTIGDGADAGLPDSFVVVSTDEQLADITPVTLNRDGELRLANVTETIGALTLNGGTVTNSGSANILNLNGHVTAATNGIINVAGILSLGDATKVFTVAAGSALQLFDAITGAAGLTKDGAGELRLQGSLDNSYAGETTVNDGLLLLNKPPGVTAVPGALTIGDGAGTDIVRVLGANQIAAAAPVTVNSSGQLDLVESAETIGSLTLEGGAVTMATGTLTLNGNVIVGEAATSASISGRLDLAGVPIMFTVADGAATSDLLVSAVVTNGAILKSGPGTMVLSGANSYTGDTTITAGRLLINGTQPDSIVYVQNGSVLGGNGRIGVLLATEGTVSPGTNAPGMLRVDGGVALTSNAVLVAQLDGTTLGENYDHLRVIGAVELNGATLDLQLGFAPAPGASFMLIQNDGIDPVIGAFAGLPEGAVFPLNGGYFTFSYAGGSGNDVVLIRVIGPAALSGPVRLGDGQFQFQGLGEAGFTYTIQANLNLNTTNWLTIGAAPANGAGRFQFLDFNAPLFPRRFYRAVSP